MATASPTPAPGPGSPTTYDPPALLPRIVRRWWLILAVTVLAVAAAAAYSSRQTDQYRAEALVQVNFGAAALVVGPNQLPSSDDQRRVQTESALMASRRVQDGAEALVGDDLPDVEVASSPSANDIVTIAVTDPDAAFAAKAANAYVESYLTISGRATANQLQPARRAAQKSVNQDGFEIARLQRELVAFTSANGPGATAVKTQLSSLLDQQLTDQQTVDRLDQAASLGSLNARLFSKATVPTDPSYPRPLRTVVVAGGFALVLAALIAAAVPLRRSTRSRA